MNWLNAVASRLRTAPVALFALGVVLLGLLAESLGADQPLSRVLALIAAQGAVFLLAVWLVLRQPRSPGMLAIVLGFAALFRLLLLSQPPYLSDDVYRYVWDGRVQAAGINPYRYVPADPALMALRDDAVYPFINRRDSATTIYPPVAQGIFFFVTRLADSVTGMKAAMVGFEALALAVAITLLRAIGQPAERVIILAWHPLMLWEFSGSGHVDAAMIALVALACLARWYHRPFLTGAAIACAILIKPLPLALLPALYRRWDWRMPTALVSVAILAYLPYVGVGGQVVGFLPGYLREERIIEGGGFFLANLVDRIAGRSIVPGLWYGIVAGTFLVALALVVSWREAERRREGFLVAAAISAIAVTILASPHYPWYFAWLIFFLCFKPWPPALFLTALCPIQYIRFVFEPPKPLLWPDAVLYGTFVAAVGLYLLIVNRAGTSAGQDGKS